MKTRLVVLGVVLSAAACGSDIASAPRVTVPRDTTSIGPVAHALSGTVYLEISSHTAPLGGAQIEVSELYPDIGTTLATSFTDSFGHFRMDGMPATLWMRASRNGFEPSAWRQISLDGAETGVTVYLTSTNRK